MKLEGRGEAGEPGALGHLETVDGVVGRGPGLMREAQFDPDSRPRPVEKRLSPLRQCRVEKRNVLKESL